MKPLLKKAVLITLIFSVWSCNKTNQVVQEKEPWSDLMNAEFIESYPTKKQPKNCITRCYFNAPLNP